MNPKEIREEKVKLEQAVWRLLNDFETHTETTVKELSLDRYYYVDGSSNLEGVKITLTL